MLYPCKLYYKEKYNSCTKSCTKYVQEDYLYDIPEVSPDSIVPAYAVRDEFLRETIETYYRVNKKLYRPIKAVSGMETRMYEGKVLHSHSAKDSIFAPYYGEKYAETREIAESIFKVFFSGVVVSDGLFYRESDTPRYCVGCNRGNVFVLATNNTRGIVSTADAVKLFSHKETRSALLYAKTLHEALGKDASLTANVRIIKLEQETPTREFFVDTPKGKLRVYAKHNVDTPEDYPGAFVDSEDGDCLACVEYDSTYDRLQTCVYQPGQDEPVSVVVHESLREEDSE